MKSAYELAMERLEKEQPTAKLTDAQREAIAEVGKKFEAQIAERELFLDGEIAKARAAGDGTALEQLERQRTLEVRRLREECEEAKDKLRHAST